MAALRGGGGSPHAIQPLPLTPAPLVPGSELKENKTFAFIKGVKHLEEPILWFSLQWKAGLSHCPLHHHKALMLVTLRWNVLTTYGTKWTLCHLQTAPPSYLEFSFWPGNSSILCCRTLILRLDDRSTLDL
jgi:hypothetical protein